MRTELELFYSLANAKSLVTELMWLTSCLFFRIACWTSRAGHKT